MSYGRERPGPKGIDWILIAGRYDKILQDIMVAPQKQSLVNIFCYFMAETAWPPHKLEQHQQTQIDKLSNEESKCATATM